MRGLLIRVGIDSTDGHWNAPVDSRTGEFAYVTITEVKKIRLGLVRLFDEFVPAVSRFNMELPDRLKGLPTHLDPDFSTLTYGDQGQRAQQIGRLEPGDLLVFFASLRDIHSGKLLYALIGLYVIDQILLAKTIDRNAWSENAHTRRFSRSDDIVVRARKEGSGRLQKCIPIGEYRDRAYRVTKDLLKAWGDLEIENGYLQRSVRLPAFRDTDRFYEWFENQHPALIRANNYDNRGR
jgi:hypothetical protein